MGEARKLAPAPAATVAPPDGGWGYFIWISVIINYLNASIFAICYGLIFNQFMAEIQLDATDVGLLNGCATFLMALAGYATGPLMKRFSARQLAVLGALLLNLGNLGTCFSADKASFYFVSIVQSLGCGVLFIVSNTALNAYWLKKRLLSTSVTQSVLAVSGIVSPCAVSWLLAEYGYRGTVLLLTGLSMHCFVAAALIQPVEWHLKVVPQEEGTTDKVITEIPLKAKHEEVLLKTKHEEIPLKSKLVDAVVDVEDHNRHSEAPDTLVKRLVVLLDLHLLSDVRVVSACVGLALCLFSDGYYCLVLPRALFLDKWTESDVAWALMMIGFGDLAMKVLFMLLSKFLVRVTNRTLYMYGIALAIFSRLGMLGSKSPRAVVAYLTLLGVARSALGSLPPLVLADVVHQRHFASANGLMVLMFGVNGLVFGPLLGAVSDISGNFASSFYVMTSFFGIVLMFWCIEACYRANEERERARAANKTRH